MVRYLLAIAFLSSALSASPLFAGIFVNGSVSQSSQNAGYLTHDSSSGSAGFDVSLGTYVRVGLSHSQEFSVSKGWVLQDDAEDSDAASSYDNYTSRTHAWANSVDFTFILYNGQVVVPYLKAGLVWKTYIIEEEQNGVVSKDGYRNQGPWDNLGAGVGFKLNRDFTLKLFYNTSPGIQAIPGEDKARTVRDKKATIGLTYQL
jgi:hypothetical protein